MTQTELNAAVAAATGESLATIDAMGFSLAMEGVHDLDEASICEPQVVDWDVSYTDRPQHLPSFTFADAITTTAFV